MVPPIYKKPPGPKDTGGQTGNLLYKYYTTHWQNVNDTMLIWCGSKFFNFTLLTCYSKNNSNPYQLYKETRTLIFTINILVLIITPSQEVCSLIFTLRLRSHLMTYLLYLPLPQGLIYHPEQVNILQDIFLVSFPPECHAFYDRPMPYTYLPPLPFHHT